MRTETLKRALHGAADGIRFLGGTRFMDACSVDDSIQRGGGVRRGKSDRKKDVREEVRDRRGRGRMGYIEGNSSGR